MRVYLCSVLVLFLNYSTLATGKHFLLETDDKKDPIHNSDYFSDSKDKKEEESGKNFLYVCNHDSEIDLKELQKQISAGADINQQDEYGMTCLMDAAMEGRYEAAKILIENKADVNEKTKKGFTALSLAVRFYKKGKTLQVVKLLLENGADPNIKNRKGKTALFFASVFGDREVEDLLLEKGASPDRKYKAYKKSRARKGGRKQQGQSREHLAKGGSDYEQNSGQTKDIEELRRLKDDYFKNQRETKEDKEIKRKRKGLGSKTTTGSDYSGNNQGKSVNDQFLHHCHDRPKVINENEEVEEGNKEEAAEENKEDAGDNKDEGDEKERPSPPKWKLTDENKKIYLDRLESLINEGADINIQDNIAGLTCLILKAHSGNFEATKLLIEKGADVNIKNDEGKDALFVAKEGGHQKVADLLIEKWSQQGTKGTKGSDYQYTEYGGQIKI